MSAITLDRPTQAAPSPSRVPLPGLAPVRRPARPDGPGRPRRLRAVPCPAPSAGRSPRAQAAPVGTADPTPLRLTVRGRRVVLVLGTLVILGLSALLVRAAARGQTGDLAPPAHQASPAWSSTVVRPGETLWEIAVRIAPRADPRLTVARIEDLNGLDGDRVRPGEQLRLPAG